MAYIFKALNNYVLPRVSAREIITERQKRKINNNKESWWENSVAATCNPKSNLLCKVSCVVPLLQAQFATAKCWFHKSLQSVQCILNLDESVLLQFEEQSWHRSNISLLIKLAVVGFGISVFSVLSVSLTFVRLWVNPFHGCATCTQWSPAHSQPYTNMSPWCGC